MKRRNALKITASVLGTAIIGSEVFFSGCTNPIKSEGLFSDNDTALLDEIGETILPESDGSPGAKAAKIGQFMQIIVRDCYDENETEIFIKGLKEIKTTSITNYKSDFMNLSMDQRVEMLTEYDRITKEKSEDDNPHFYSMIKQLCIWGYFTSEVGATKALRYNPIPGRYQPCIEYKVGDKAWA